MDRKAALFFFLFSIGAITAIALFLPRSDDSGALLQRQHVDAALLNSGETGKILKTLNIILPLENKHKDVGFESNVVEVIGRASKDYKKWIQLDQYKKYRERGIFCYLEMQTKGKNSPIYVYTKRNGEWQKDRTFEIRSHTTVYAFFLDSTETELEIYFEIANTDSSLTINTMAFLREGYHPVVYSDRVGLSRLLSKINRSIYEIKAGAIVLKEDEHVKILKTTLRFKDKWMVGVSKFQKKQGDTHIEMIPRNQHPLIVGQSEKDVNLAEMSKGGLPIISIDVQEEDLYSEEYGILKNFDQHGRDWERLSYVQYFKDGEQVIGGFSGLRLQGGDPGREKGLINFRVFFREEYGKSKVQGSKIFDRPIGDIKRLAIKQSEWEKWPLNSPLAYAVSHKIGAWAPPTESVTLYLNGKNLGLYYVVPHLGEKQLEQMLPKGEYQFYRWRGAQHLADREFFTQKFWVKLQVWIQGSKITKKYAEQFFDLDNLSTQLFSYLYNGTGDFCQGIAAKETAEGAKMFWLSWDMDHSFVDVKREINDKGDVERERWEQPPYLSEFFAQETKESRHYCPRVRLFRRLVNDDPVFREQVKEVFMEIMNHRVTDEKISLLLYETWSDLTKADYSFRDEYISVLSDFFLHRKQFIIKQMEQALPTAPVRTCNVDSDEFPISVDGYTKVRRYEGYYFPGSVLRLETDVNSNFKHWLINGEIHNRHKVDVPVSLDQECQIKAVFH